MNGYPVCEHVARPDSERPHCTSCMANAIRELEKDFAPDILLYIQDESRKYRVHDKQQ